MKLLSYREAAMAIEKVSTVDAEFSIDLPRKIGTFIELVCESDSGDITPVSFGMIAYHLQLHPQDVKKAVREGEDMVVIEGYLALTKYRYDEMMKKQVKETQVDKSMV